MGDEDGGDGRDVNDTNGRELITGIICLPELRV